MTLRPRLSRSSLGPVSSVVTVGTAVLDTDAAAVDLSGFVIEHWAAVMAS